MKKIMKKALSLALALVMVLAMTPMTAKAEDTEAALGEYTNPYQLSTDSVRFYVYVEPAATVYVQASDITGTVNVGYATGDYMLGYGRQTVYPNNDTEKTATLSLQGGDGKFSVYNSGSEAVSVYMTLSAGTPQDTTGTWEDPEILELQNMYGNIVAEDEVSLAAENQGYYYKVVAPGNGKLGVSWISSDVEWQYCVTNNDTSGTTGNHWSDDDPVVNEDYVTVSEGDEVIVWVATYDPDNMFANPAGGIMTTVRFIEAEAVDGDSASNPIETTAGNSYTNTCNMTYYTYTAAADGVLTLTTTGATYSGFNTVNGDSPSLDDYTSADGVLKMQLKKGDEVVYWLSGTAGSTKVAVSYENGATLQKNEDDKNYVVSDTMLKVGSNSVVQNEQYKYTLFVFEPTEDGIYQISTDKGTVGIWGYSTASGVYYEPSDPAATVISSSVTTNNEIVIGLTGVEAIDATATITVTKVANAVSNVTPTIYAGIEATPAAYKYAGDESALTRVAFADDTEDVVYLGSDGYYHLNAINGPIVLVDLADDAIINLFDAANLGRLNGVKEISGTTYKWDFNSLVMYYTSCTEAGYVLNPENLEYKIGNGSTLYPLTVQLMQMLQEVGNNPSNNWYGEGGYIANTEDAWMFCCYYDKNYTTDTPIVNVADIPATPAEDILADAGVKFEEGKVVIDKEALAILVEANKSQPIQITATTAKGDIVFRFEANTMSDAGLEKYSFAASVTTNYDGIKDTVVSKDSIALRIDFAHSGKLPGTAKVTIPVDKAYAGKTLYYYLINEDGTLTYTGSCGVVNAKGEVTVSQNHCSSYVLSTQAPAQDAANPKTGDDMNLGLWAAILMLGLAGVTVVMRKKSF